MANEKQKREKRKSKKKRYKNRSDEIHHLVSDLKAKVAYDAMTVLFRRYELAKPSSRLIYEGKWITTFCSSPKFMYKVVATTPHGKLLSIYGKKNVIHYAIILSILLVGI